MKKRSIGNTPFEKYIGYLDEIFQEEPQFFMNESDIEGLPGVTSIVYKDIPEKGMVTGLTYGLSLIGHEDWKYGRPELLISVETSDLAWGQAVGVLANRLRGDCPFSYGNTINFGERISDDSEMDAFLIFGPSILDKKDFLNIDVGMDYQIHLAGIYPIYSSELNLVRGWGIEKFWHHPSFNMYNVKRNRIKDIL